MARIPDPRVARPATEAVCDPLPDLAEVLALIDPGMIPGTALTDLLDRIEQRRPAR